MFREQSRPDKDSYVTINTQNIWADQDGNFKHVDETKLLGNPYDFKLVMHYPTCTYTYAFY